MYRQKIQPLITEKRILYSVSLELTYRCNLDCFFCYNDRSFKGRDLSLDQYIDLLQDLADMQTLFLMLTGGEPMVHPHFFAIGAAARDSGFVTRVRTNGHTLTSKVARRLLNEVDPYIVEMSLHGGTAETHDRQTRVPGSFDRLLANIKGMTELGLRQGLVTTPTSWNEHELALMFDLSDELGVPLRFQGPVAPRDNGDTEPLSIQPSRNAWRIISEIQRQRGTKEEFGCSTDDKDAPVNTEENSGDESRDRERLCGIGQTGVDIDPYGNVYPCMHLKNSAGNLHEQSICDIWNGVTGRKVFKEAEQLSIDAALRFKDTSPEQFGAPLYCPAAQINSEKSCSEGTCNSASCGG